MIRPLPLLAFYFVWVFGLLASAQETERQYLSGRDKDDTVAWRFQCTSGARSGEWTTLPVPSHWDVLGFGTLNYHKDLESAHDEKGLYEHEFEVPGGWSDRHVFLVFDGAMTDTTATLNGQSVGPMHQGGFYPFRYEITKLLKFDAPNRLEVTVAKHSANESINRAERIADYWVFGGIYRPVYLEAVPEQFIERVAIDARANGEFAIDVYTRDAANGDTLEAHLFELDGKSVGEPFTAKVTGEKTTLTTKIDPPRQWTAETPNLYRVEVRLKRGGEIVHQYPQRFGFRTIEVRDGDGIYVNGRRVILKGVNRHSSWPDSGRCLSEKIHRLDIETMKDMNMNAVRMSHYPPDTQFLDLCDELGLYVLDELAGWQKVYDTPTGTRLVESLVKRDVNHPSILFWNNGNEGGFNKELDPVFGRFDPQQRRVLHPWEEFNGINTAHYLEYDRAKVASRGAPTRHGTGEKYEEWEEPNHPQKFIYMPTEFLHGLYDGGAGAGFEDYWNMMTESPLLGGAFFWVFADEGVKRPDTGQIDCAGNAAPDGIVGPYREREGSFYTIKEIWSPIEITRNDDGTFTIENHYSFTNVNQCKFTYAIERRFPQPNDSAAKQNDLSGTIPAPSIPPGTKATVKLELPKFDSPAEALAIRVDDPTGRELWTYVWPLEGIQRYRSLPDTPADGAATAKQTDDAILLTTGALEIQLDPKSGFLAGVRRGDKTFSFTNGPQAVPGISILTNLAVVSEGSDAIVKTTYQDAPGLIGEGLRQITWRLRPNGWLQCEYRYEANGQADFHGIAFDLPEKKVRSKRWLGNGPFRVWKNRLGGGTLGVWENEYNNTITGYSGWQYPEFKGCFSDVYWMQLETDEGPITIVPGSQHVFVQVLTPDVPPENLIANTKVSLPKVGVAILHAIPPIGSKFKTADGTGPQGQLNLSSGEYSGVVNFYFGELR